ncbi:uncharacterized protein [Apostichopus japonicus]|uniref:uncharacterized protein n=1 Tax=Stichopus japonicus TaxID=307972 RepID=UPI003AB77FEA
MKSISSVLENQTLSAECCVTFTDSRIQVKYLWSVDTALATTYRTNFTGSLICSNVSFTATRKHHNKLLVCTVENELNSTTQERINVTYPASAEWIPPYNAMTSVIAERYTSLTITCTSDGNPPPHHILQRYDTNMTRWVNTSIIPDLIKEEGTQRTWTLFYNVTNSISERLRCFAFNGFTNQEEGNGFLVETQVPATVAMFSKQTYDNGVYQVVIDCVTYGHPIPDVYLQKKVLDNWETVMDVFPAIDNVTTKRRQVTWDFYFRVENSKEVDAYRCRANNTFRHFDDSNVVMINIKLTFDVFLVENLQAIICVFVASVIIVALLVAFKYYQKKVSRNFLPAVTRYSRLVRNSIHFPSNFHRASNNQAPTLPDTRSIPGFGSNITRDQSVDPYEELPCNDVDGKEAHALDFYLPGDVASYAAVQKNSCTTLSAGHDKSKQEEEDDDDYIGISLELQITQI